MGHERLYYWRRLRHVSRRRLDTKVRRAISRVETHNLVLWPGCSLFLALDLCVRFAIFLFPFGETGFSERVDPLLSFTPSSVGQLFGIRQVERLFYIRGQVGPGR